MTQNAALSSHMSQRAVCCLLVWCQVLVAVMVPRTPGLLHLQASRVAKPGELGARTSPTEPYANTLPQGGRRPPDATDLVWGLREPNGRPPSPSHSGPAAPISLPPKKRFLWDARVPNTAVRRSEAHHNKAAGPWGRQPPREPARVQYFWAARR